MVKDYRDVGIESYGDRCELCGHAAIVEVHHTHYQEHQIIEDCIRRAFKNGTDTSALLNEAHSKGWETFDTKTMQLDRGKRPDLLSVLCGNCHSLIHKMDVGLLLLKALKPRVKEERP